MEFYGLNPQKKHLFVVGGSLGSGTLNRAMMHWIQDGCPEGEGVEVIWQCGKYYKNTIDTFMQAHPEVKGIRHYDFIGRMDLAYAAADVVISRSGASTVSELCAMGKATVFVPSPNVAEDHQTHNAMALPRRRPSGEGFRGDGRADAHGPGPAGKSRAAETAVPQRRGHGPSECCTGNL